MIPTNTRPGTAINLSVSSSFSLHLENDDDQELQHSWGMASLQNEKAANAKRKRVPDDGREAAAIGSAYTDDDILQGRGKGVSKHKGNRRFRKIIKRYCNSYTKAKTNQERKKIVDLVLGEVHNRGRFLELCNSQWVVLTEKKIREKVSQALRYQQRVQVSGTDTDNRSVCSSASEGDDVTSIGSAAVAKSVSESDILSSQLFGELTEVDQLEATQSLEEWGIEPVAVDPQPLMTDQEILASVGAVRLAHRDQSDGKIPALDPHQEFEDLL